MTAPELRKKDGRCAACGAYPATRKSGRGYLCGRCAGDSGGDTYRIACLGCGGRGILTGDYVRVGDRSPVGGVRCVWCRGSGLVCEGCGEHEAWCACKGRAA